MIRPPEQRWSAQWDAQVTSAGEDARFTSPANQFICVRLTAGEATTQAIYAQDASECAKTASLLENANPGQEWRRYVRVSEGLDPVVLNGDHEWVKASTIGALFPGGVIRGLRDPGAEARGADAQRERNELAGRIEDAHVSLDSAGVPRGDDEHGETFELDQRIEYLAEQLKESRAAVKRLTRKLSGAAPRGKR